MNTPTTELPQTLSDAARERFVAREEKPTFVCEWPRVLFAHYEVEREVLQRHVPFELELLEGQAVVSLVAFTMHRFHPRWGGRLMEWLARPVSTNHFFNVRTYVRHGGEPGVFFMHQWLSHPFCLLTRLPGLRLPWHWGRMHYEHRHETGCVTGSVREGSAARLIYSATFDTGTEFVPPAPGSLAEFCLERYTAFAYRSRTPVVFRIWHEPWPQCTARFEVDDRGLLTSTDEWFNHPRFLGANYSVGCRKVWMGIVRKLEHTESV